MRDALEVSVNLDKFPKSVIDVYALVLEDDGSALAAAIICGSLALADAGVELYDIVSACAAVRCLISI
jgi:exosome complex component MTR3